MLLDNLETLAQSYASLKTQKAGGHSGSASGESIQTDLARIALTIVDTISSPDFAFPVKKEGLESNGTTSYTYEQNIAFPALFDFLSEILHASVPIEIMSTKFGPGEILVKKGNKIEADIELALSTKELQKLVHARRAEISTKHAGAAATAPP